MDRCLGFDSCVEEVVSSTLCPSSDPEVLLEDTGIFTSVGWQWRLPCRHALFGWEVELWNQFLVTINGVVPSREDDGLLWLGDGNGRYSVKVYTQVLETEFFWEPSWVVPREISRIVPPKVTEFMWQVVAGKIAVMDSWRRRGVEVDGEAICVLCGLGVETVQHLMLTCEFVAQI